jgi:hypothetical protein
MPRAEGENHTFEDNMARKTTEPAESPETTAPDVNEVNAENTRVNDFSDTFQPPDEFASPEFVDPNGKMPRIQALRGEHNLDHCGYFIPFKDIALAGWQNLDESQVITYTFQSGDEEQGLLFKEPRMIVCPKTSLLAWDRKAS